MDLKLFTKYLTGETTEKEKEQVEDLIKSSSKKKAVFDRLNYIWNKSPEISFFEKINSLEDWNNIKSKFRHNFKLRAGRISAINYITKIASVFILACGLSFILYKVSTAFTEPNVTTISTNELTKNFILSDGSEITLNKNSHLSFTSRYNKKDRKLALDGEAYFNIHNNNKLPCIILTNKSSVEVIGTQFNIKEDTSDVKITVISGKVLFYETGNEINKVELKKNETASYHMASGKIIYSQNTDTNFISWKTGKFIFSKTPTADVLSSIATHFNKKLIIQSPLNDSITGIFDNQPLDEILNEIEITSSLKIQYDKDYIVVKK